jgi:hypothetical protein
LAQLASSIGKRPDPGDGKKPCRLVGGGHNKWVAWVGGGEYIKAEWGYVIKASNLLLS